MKKKKQKRQKWLKFRHKIVRNLAFAVLYPYSRIKFGIKREKFKEQGDRQYLIVMNHQTVFDQFFCGMCFKGPIYYLATEDIFSNGWVSKAIKYLVNPIPIKKQTNDMRAVLNCIHIVREGGTIALAPEGNRTYSGRTEYMKPTISQLAKKLNIPLAILRIEGGYGVQPRWTDVVRKGEMKVYVSRVVEPEEYKVLSDDELYELIKKELYVDEAVVSGEFKSKKSAEYLERAMYVCPYCGLSEFESNGEIIECKKCGRKIKYLSTKELEGVGFEFPFRFVANWYDYQQAFINRLDIDEYFDKPLYTDTAAFSEVILYKNKKLIDKNASITLYGNKIVFGDGTAFSFDDVSVITVLGRNKLNIYHNDKVYQFKGGKRFNALKYMNIYFRYKNTREGNENDEFLGI